MSYGGPAWPHGRIGSSASPVLRQNSQNIGLYLVGAQLVWSGNSPPEQASNGRIHRRVLVRAWSHDASTGDADEPILP